jgi:hypothetical protein
MMTAYRAFTVEAFVSLASGLLQTDLHCISHFPATIRQQVIVYHQENSRATKLADGTLCEKLLMI